MFMYRTALLVCGNYGEPEGEEGDSKAKASVRLEPCSSVQVFSAGIWYPSLKQAASQPI